MTQNDLLTIFKETFPTAVFTVPFESLELNAVPEWDSLGNLNLLLRVEETLGIRFSTEELSEVKSIKQLVTILMNKGIYEDQ
jgi:acyl carrier protein